jgi:hypothetical protein
MNCVWWWTPVIPALRRQRPGLYSETLSKFKSKMFCLKCCYCDAQIQTPLHFYIFGGFMRFKNGSIAPFHRGQNWGHSMMVTELGGRDQNRSPECPDGLLCFCLGQINSNCPFPWTNIGYHLSITGPVWGRKEVKGVKELRKVKSGFTEHTVAAWPLRKWSFIALNVLRFLRPVSMWGVWVGAMGREGKAHSKRYSQRWTWKMNGWWALNREGLGSKSVNYLCVQRATKKWLLIRNRNLRGILT